jgi:hypothetical protein
LWQRERAAFCGFCGARNARDADVVQPFPDLRAFRRNYRIVAVVSAPGYGAGGPRRERWPRMQALDGAARVAFSGCIWPTSLRAGLGGKCRIAAP